VGIKSGHPPSRTGFPSQDEKTEGSMKIADLTTTWLSMPLKEPIADSTHTGTKVIEWILVDILTDAGITGRSLMLTFDFAPELLRGVVEKELKRRIVGKDPLYIKGIQEICWN
jgi:L-alanine-DL-glutamate epimerase-like enolase superfamily enzyme